MNWQVATPGGVFVAEVVGGGFNIFFIKNTDTNQMRGYIQPVAGVGGGLSASGLKLIWSIIQRLLTRHTVFGARFHTCALPSATRNL